MSPFKVFAFNGPPPESSEKKEYDFPLCQDEVVVKLAYQLHDISERSSDPIKFDSNFNDNIPLKRKVGFEYQPVVHDIDNSIEISQNNFGSPLR